MSRTYVNALVLKNDGNTVQLRPQDGSNQEVTMRRDKESVQEFLQMFPLQGMVEIFHDEGELSPEEEKTTKANWITVKVLSNDGEEASVRFPGDEKIKFYRGDKCQGDFLKAWPPGDAIEFQIRDVERMEQEASDGKDPET